MVFRARLHDPAHGSVMSEASTAELAVELAFRELAMRWMHPNDVAKWPVDSEMFDGELRGIGEGLWEVWWNNRAWSLLGTVLDCDCIPDSEELDEELAPDDAS